MSIIPPALNQKLTQSHVPQLAEGAL